MRKSLAGKLAFIILVVAVVVYFTIPNIHIVFSKIAPQRYKHITIFYTNDSHGRLRMDPMNRTMGMAQIKYLMDRNRDKNTPVLLLDAGDVLYGSNETDLNQGTPMVELMNAMHYTAMTIGNHEFDFGFDQTMRNCAGAKFHILSANLFKNETRIFEPYTIVNVAGINFGIVGISTEDTLTRTKPEYVKDLSLRNDAETLREILPEVRAKSDYIILLAHEHIETLEKLARQFPEIGLIIAGHDHIEVASQKIGGTCLVSSGVFLQKLGKVDLVFHGKKAVYTGGRLLSIRGKRAQDPQILKMTEGFHKKIFRELNVKIGETQIDLTDYNRSRFEEVNFGNAITDAMRETAGADIALQNGGGIRANIIKGDLTLYKINQAFPFINYVIVVEMTGAEIKQALEHGVEKYPTEWNGGFMQVSGLSYTFDAAKPSGQRLVDVSIGGNDIDERRTYTVATNDFLYQGGDGYDVIKRSKLLYNSGLLIRDVFAGYIKQRKIINPGIEGRIKVLNQKN
jgi:2',3'-cyclic-nucleotide 2'-phosphodiesterase (5'-nucleotidase family)